MSKELDDLYKVDTPDTCLTDGSPITPDHRDLKYNGQQKGYVVLCPEERAKGFVRPLRRSYKHIGKKICGDLLPTTDKKLGGPRYMCNKANGHEGNHHYEFITQWESAQPENRRIGGCGTVTTMGLALCETYARDPYFYGSTFCVGCGTHLPVEEFNWVEDGQQVGS